MALRHQRTGERQHTAGWAGPLSGGGCAHFEVPLKVPHKNFLWFFNTLPKPTLRRRLTLLQNHLLKTKLPPAGETKSLLPPQQLPSCFLRHPKKTWTVGAAGQAGVQEIPQVFGSAGTGWIALDKSPDFSEHDMPRLQNHSLGPERNHRGKTFACLTSNPALTPDTTHSTRSSVRSDS